jgi:hypothetical protein
VLAAAACVMGHLLPRTSQNSVMAKFAFWGFSEVRIQRILRSCETNVRQSALYHQGALETSPLRRSRKFDSMGSRKFILPEGLVIVVSWFKL